MSYNIGDWMWIVGDTNPTTQVYSSASGGMIANNSAASLTWLSGRAGAIAIGTTTATRSAPRRTTAAASSA